LPDDAVKWLTPRVAVGGGGRFGQWHDAGVKPELVSPAARSRATHGFRIGQSVRHARFGDGVIVNLEGAGDEARAQVNFGPQGVKWLLLGVAKATV
jgi:DNA helicase-2/ATP-dependent DNA helicase PcrA